MVSMYEIKDYNNEETLFLYFNCFYEEYGSEFLEKGKDIVSEVKSFLKTLDDRFQGKKIMIVVNGILLSTLITSGGNITIDKMFDEVKGMNFNQVEMLKPINFLDNWNNQVVSRNALRLEMLEDIDTDVVIDDEVVKVESKDVVDKSSNIINSDSSSVSKGNNSSPKENIVENKPVEEKVVDNSVYVSVLRSNGIVERIELEEYIIGVVGAEMPASFGVEALKAQALVARTYALRQMREGKTLTDTVSTQSYNDVNQLKVKWGSSFNTYYNKIKLAVLATTGEYITYNGKYIDAVYHSTSNGKTEDAIYVWGNDIPYLRSVDSRWDLRASSYLRQVEKDINQINTLLGLELNDEVSINVLDKSTSGRINKIEIAGKVFEGKNLYAVLGLRSRDFDISINEGKVVITTRGYGHGVGMSQYGAAGMAAEGYSYRQIINHYYQGVKVLK